MNVVEIDERRVEAFLEPLADIEPARRPRKARRRPARRVAVAAVVLALVAGATVPLAGDRLGTPSAAAQALERAAVVAANQPVLPPGGRYSYAKTLSKTVTSFEGVSGFATRYVTEELWLALDGSGRIRTTSGPIRFPSPAARAAWQRDRDLYPTDDEDRRFTLRRHFRDVAGLPADPDRLLELVREESERASSGPRGVEPYESLEHLMWARFVDLLVTMNSEINTRPQLRAAAFRAASHLEDTILLGEMLDPMGRHGIGIAFSAIEGYRDVLVFDPRTSKILAFKTLSSGVVLGGQRRTWAAYLEAGRVRSLQERPR